MLCFSWGLCRHGSARRLQSSSTPGWVLCCQHCLYLGHCSSVTECYLVTEQNSLAHLLCGQKAKGSISTLMSNRAAFSRQEQRGQLCCRCRRSVAQVLYSALWWHYHSHNRQLEVFCFDFFSSLKYQNCSCPSLMVGGIWLTFQYELITPCLSTLSALNFFPS